MEVISSFLSELDIFGKSFLFSLNVSWQMVINWVISPLVQLSSLLKFQLPLFSHCFVLLICDKKCYRSNKNVKVLYQNNGQEGKLNSERKSCLILQTTQKQTLAVKPSWIKTLLSAVILHETQSSRGSEHRVCPPPPLRTPPKRGRFKLLPQVNPRNQNPRSPHPRIAPGNEPYDLPNTKTFSI